MVSRTIFAACLCVVKSTSRVAPVYRWWTKAVADTVSCAASGQRARNGRSGVLRPEAGNMSRNTATPSFPFSAKALTTGLRSWSPLGQQPSAGNRPRGDLWEALRRDRVRCRRQQDVQASGRLPPVQPGEQAQDHRLPCPLPG